MIILNIILILLLISVVAFCLNGYEDYNNSRMSFKEALDLVELPILTFTVGDKKLNLMLDSGSNVSYINASVVETIPCEIAESEIAYFTGIDGEKRETSAIKLNMFYRNIGFENVFHVSSMEQAFADIKASTGVQIHGVLGNRFFTKYKYILDFESLCAYSKK
jgi:hypothetical protein